MKKIKKIASIVLGLLSSVSFKSFAEQKNSNEDLDYDEDLSFYQMSELYCNQPEKTYSPPFFSNITGEEILLYGCGIGIVSSAIAIPILLRCVRTVRARKIVDKNKSYILETWANTSKEFYREVGYETQRDLMSNLDKDIILKYIELMVYDCDDCKQKKIDSDFRVGGEGQALILSAFLGWAEVLDHFDAGKTKSYCGDSYVRDAIYLIRIANELGKTEINVRGDSAKKLLKNAFKIVNKHYEKNERQKNEVNSMLGKDFLKLHKNWI